MSIQQQIISLKNELPEYVTLVAVSKTHPSEAIQEAYNSGQRIFAENRVQELTAKQPVLPADIQWHMIGHMQTNKIKYIAAFIHTIQSIDSLNVLKEINKEAKKNNRVIRCLLEIFVAQEETKYGLDYSEAKSILESDDYEAMQNIEITGVMGMASFTDSETQIRSEFRKLKSIFTDLKDNFFKENATFSILSMGMSGDYKLAIEEGSNMVRIGSTIFGNRVYK